MLDLYSLQCNRTQSLDMFHKVIHKRENFVQHIGLIGAGCSTASLPVAEISHYYNIPMVGKGEEQLGWGEERGKGEGRWQ